MYTYSIPVMFTSMTEETRPSYAAVFKQAQIDRVFLCMNDPLWAAQYLKDHFEKVKTDISYFRNQGFEVGVWINAFGHGGPLSHDVDGLSVSDSFTKLEGIDGRNEYSYCPLDTSFSDMYADVLQQIAAAGPSLIMLDDDYRLNYRNYRLGCTCPLHLEAFYQRIGTVIPKEELETRIFSGPANFYRTEWLSLMRDTLINFARKMRRAVDAVDPTIRMGVCQCWDTWDFEGCDGIELARACAGNTKPFLRTIGAPYHKVSIPLTIETNRLQAHWCKNQGIEVFTEGDVYPRPRYNVPARYLELFDLALLASGETNGILKYMFDYTRPLEYEKGYYERHIKNAPIRKEIAEMFKDAQATGIYIVDAMRKTENWHLPEETPAGISSYLASMMESSRLAKSMLVNNAIPITYERNEHPLFIMGENAWYVDESELSQGAILDISAAMILTKRGIDVGLMDAHPAAIVSETYLTEDDTISGIQNMHLFAVSCSPKAQIETLLNPGKTPGSYHYENTKGQRFFVLASSLLREDFSSCMDIPDYTSNYYRKKQLVSVIEWVSNRPLTVKTTSPCPNLYMIVSENAAHTKASVAIMNAHADDASDIVFSLSKPGCSARFAGCEGVLDGKTVTVSYMEPYGFAAFEVSFE